MRLSRGKTNAVEANGFRVGATHRGRPNNPGQASCFAFNGFAGTGATCPCIDTKTI